MRQNAQNRSRNSDATEKNQQKTATQHYQAARCEIHANFNKLLANVQQLVEDHSPNASPMLSNLIAYLRAVVPQMRTDMTQLRNEFDMVSHYLTIMQMRMGTRLRWSVSLPEELQAFHVPPLIVIRLSKMRFSTVSTRKSMAARSIFAPPNKATKSELMSSIPAKECLRFQAIGCAMALVCRTCVNGLRPFGRGRRS
jgi:Histidine kinase